jgi:hypothetical protein
MRSLMSRKDYEMIVRVLNDPTLHLPDAKRNALASRFADELQKDNPNFNRSRFMKACCG